LVLAVVLAGLALWQGSRLRLDDDIARLLPDGDRDLTASASVLARFPVMERMLIDVSAAEPVGPEALRDATRILAEQLRATPGVAWVRAELGPGQALDLVELLRERAALLLAEQDHREIERRLQPEALDRRLQSLLRRLQEPDGGATALSIANDPLGIADLALRPLAAVAQSFGGARLLHGFLTSSDHRHLLLQLHPSFRA
jgi:hypothetical protein